MSHPTNAMLRELLEISDGTQETTEDFFSVEIIAACAIAVLLSVTVIVIISTLIVKRCDTTNEHIWLISQVVISVHMFVMWFPFLLLNRRKRSRLTVVHNEATVLDLTNMEAQCNVELVGC